MTDEELTESWLQADCPIKVECVGGGEMSGGVRLTWTDDPLDFIILAPKAVRQLIEKLEDPPA